MAAIHCPKPVNQHRSIPLNIPEERKPQLHSERSLRARQRYTSLYNILQAPAVSSFLVSNNNSNNNLVITFMQGMYNYMPETNHVSTIYIALQLFCIYHLCYM